MPRPRVSLAPAPHKGRVMKEFLDKYPCIKQAAFEFAADGKILEAGAKCPDTELIGSTPGSRWKMQGQNKLVIYHEDKEVEPVVFDIEMMGNKMRWVLKYIEKHNSAGDIKLLEVVYIKA